MIGDGGIDECRAVVIRWEGKDPDSVVLYKNVECRDGSVEYCGYERENGGSNA